jgi:hypothetical protein
MLQRTGMLLGTPIPNFEFSKKAPPFGAFRDGNNGSERLGSDEFTWKLAASIEQLPAQASILARIQVSIQNNKAKLTKICLFCLLLWI